MHIQTTIRYLFISGLLLGAPIVLADTGNERAAQYGACIRSEWATRANESASLGECEEALRKFLELVPADRRKAIAAQVRASAKAYMTDLKSDNSSLQ